MLKLFAALSSMLKHSIFIIILMIQWNYFKFVFF